MEASASTSAPIPGSWQLNLKKSINRTSRSLLTPCSDEDFRNSFPNLTPAEQKRLHRLFIQVITSMHQDIEEDLESVFHETQVGTVLDSVEELVEEHNLDPLRSTKSNISEVCQSLTDAKKNELCHLTGVLEKAEEQKRKLNERLETLKKDRPDFSGAANLFNECLEKDQKCEERLPQCKNYMTRYFSEKQSADYGLWST